MLCIPEFPDAVAGCVHVSSLRAHRYGGLCHVQRIKTKVRSQLPHMLRCVTSVDRRRASRYYSLYIVILILILIPTFTYTENI